MVAYKELLNDTEFMYQFEKEYERRKEIQKAKQREAIMYYVKQKLSGLVLVVISMWLPMIDGDATASLLLLPLGVFLALTKEKVMDFKGK